ncbi:MAG: hypothetical protein Q8888_00710 [Vigna little leaf phytoplasma]|nr:hypothetical protein [Vigna little leaf phytoplasma]
MDKLDIKQKTLSKLRIFSLTNNIPIITDETMNFLQQVLIDNHFLDILEIGTAIGYSALAMSNKNNIIHTIEKDYTLACLAKQFLSSFYPSIKVIWADALIYKVKQKYDFIFIDAAKVQYYKLFQKYNCYLKPHGMIICDNLNFGYRDIKFLTRSRKRIIQKLYEFKQFLKTNKDFDNYFLNIGDGLSISWLKLFPPQNNFYEYI